MAAAVAATAATAHQHAFSLVLVRHAEKAAESADPPLSAAGRERALRLADRLEAMGIEAVWSSDYRRTRATAIPLASRLGLEVRAYDPRALAAPDLAALLCGCAVEPMGHDDYDRLLIIQVEGSARRLLERRQSSPGEASPQR
jgi:hypothetical protein